MNAHDTALNAYAYYGITTPEDERAAGELESEGAMATKRIRLDTDFTVELLANNYRPDIPMMILETMTGGRLVLSLEQAKELQDSLPKLIATLEKMIANTPGQRED